MLRKLIVTFLGHVDHGKTSLQDYIRQSTVTEREAGAITQHVGASSIPVETFKRISGHLLDALKMDLKFDGLLCIDTPGHAAFSTLRRRGGNLADLAVLVVDMNQGLQPQTIEAIEILKQYKTPFVVACNKVDLINGWKIQKDKPMVANISSQDARVQTDFETKFYEVVGKLYELGFEADRYDRVSDFGKQIAVIPTSAATGEGMPELLLMLAGLAQKFLETKLGSSDSENPGHGTILEIKEMQGVGKIMDLILYDGNLNIGDTIVIGSQEEEPIVTKIKSIFEPAPLNELMDKKSKYQQTKKVEAACGVRVLANDLDDVVSGMPIMVAKNDNLEEIKKAVQAEVDEVVIETDSDGIIIKADTLGALEALVKMLKDAKIPIRSATVGDICKKDILQAHTNYEKDPLTSVILGFNVDINKEAKEYHKETVAQIFTNSIIYKLIEEFELWKETENKKAEMAKLAELPKICKLQVLKNCIFRQSGPFVCGIEVLNGSVATNTRLMNTEGKEITLLKSMQHEKENVQKADKGTQVAASFPNLTYKRGVEEEDLFYTFMPESVFRKFKSCKDLLDDDTKSILKEIAEIMRKNNPTWGI